MDHDEVRLAIYRSMAASRSSRVTRSTVGVNGLDENFYGRTLRTRSISHAEESPPIPQPRSRSPKKKECIQSQRGTNGTKTTELKQQSLRESLLSPRKRGLSISEKDNCDKSAEDNCETEEEEIVQPVCKRIRLSPSEASDLEDELLINENETIEGKSSPVDNGAESPGHKKARRCLVLDDCDKVEVKNETGSEVGICKSVFSQEVVDYQAVNGTDEGNTSGGDCESCLPTEDNKTNSVDSCISSEQTEVKNGSSGDDCCSLSLNGSKVDSAPEPNVPCPNSQEETTSVCHKAEDKCSSCETPLNNVMVTCTPLLSINNSECNVEGNSNCSSNSQCSEGTVDSQSVVSDHVSVCKESEPSAELDSAQVDSLSELQEHRYTLRTSPRRPVLNKDSPKANSSPRVDDQVDEQKLSPERNTSTDNTSELSEKTEEIEETSQTEKLVSGDFGECSNDGVTEQPSGSGPVSGGLPSAKERDILQTQTAEEEEDDPDVYYFESDHLALKHNKDYQRLLQTIGVLESQRMQAIQDLEYLSTQAGDALKDPISFVEKLQKKIHLGFPCPQRVVQLPDIAWEQYTSSLGNFERELKNKKRNTRGLKLIFDKVGLPARPKSPLESKKDGDSSYYSVLPSSDTLESTSHSRPQMIRGRLYDETKPETFNQLWTIEEQKKLEQLLLKYPPEEIESRRWQKIADELGNRTAKQVASRVQKYFIKLTKAGIPVPGRTPNLYMYSKKSSSRKQHPLNKHLFRPSTFMTSYEPPVFMDEDDDQSSFHGSNMDTAAEDEVSDEESIPLECRHLSEYKELLELKKLKKRKLQQLKAESGFVQHVGFKCDSCGLEPILGVRWHCMDCPQNTSLDFCDACSDCLHETDLHKAHHQLKPVYRAETFLDRDYCMPQSTGYNYLDPNYYPANR